MMKGSGMKLGRLLIGLLIFVMAIENGRCGNGDTPGASVLSEDIPAQMRQIPRITITPPPPLAPRIGQREDLLRP
jgi:hypothetical protein